MKKFVTTALALALMALTLGSARGQESPLKAPPPPPSFNALVTPEGSLRFVPDDGTHAAPIYAIRIMPEDPLAEVKIAANRLNWGALSPHQAVTSEILAKVLGAPNVQKMILPIGVFPDIGASANAFGTLGTSGCTAVAGRYPNILRASDPGYDISRASFVRVQVWSQSGSNAIVTIDERSSRTGDPLVAPWFTVTNPNNIVNPSATGEYWFVPISMDLSINVPANTYSSGTICGNIETHQIGP